MLTLCIFQRIAVTFARRHLSPRKAQRKGEKQLENKCLSAWSICLTLGFFSTPFLSIAASAIPLGNGRTFFDRGPSLIRSAASSISPETPSDYEFTIVVPSDAGEPMKAVSITQKPNLQQIHFDRSKTRAFAGGASVSLVNALVSSPPDESTVTVVFDKPIEPGRTVTVSIHAKHNPPIGGVYLFGVTAFSVGENSPGLYLGSGRIHFSQPF